MSVTDRLQALRAEAKQSRVMLNIGCLLDIPSGRYHEGKNGEMILSGGFPSLVGVAGQPNTFKSLLSHAINLIAMERYQPEISLVYDTENTITEERIKTLAKELTNLNIDELFDGENPKMSLIDTLLPGNTFFEELKDYGKARLGIKKSEMVETPFLNKDGSPIKTTRPAFIEIDSFSLLTVDALEELYDKSEIGDSSLNAEAMNGGRYKSQLMSQLPSLANRANFYMIMTAHVGKEIKMDKYAPAGKTLSYIPTTLKLKRVPENFSFLTGVTYYTSSPVAMQYKEDKMCEFPLSTKETHVGDTDLTKVTVTIWRSKAEASGRTFELVFSQRDGLQVGLSELNHLRNSKFRSVGKMTYKFAFGCTGKSAYDFSLELLPDTRVMRTTARRMFNENAKLKRAMSITAELNQMYCLWQLDEKYICSPAELREDLIKMGYDWDKLLETRGYWVFKEDKHPLPFLSTLDLLRMRTGEYKPKWYK